MQECLGLREGQGVSELWPSFLRPFRFEQYISKWRTFTLEASTRMPYTRAEGPKTPNARTLYTPPWNIDIQDHVQTIPTLAFFGARTGKYLAFYKL